MLVLNWGWWRKLPAEYDRRVEPLIGLLIDWDLPIATFLNYSHRDLLFACHKMRMDGCFVTNNNFFCLNRYLGYLFMDLGKSDSTEAYQLLCGVQSLGFYIAKKNDEIKANKTILVPRKPFLCEPQLPCHEFLAVFCEPSTCLHVVLAMHQDLHHKGFMNEHYKTC